MRIKITKIIDTVYLMIGEYTVVSIEPTGICRIYFYDNIGIELDNFMIKDEE